MSKSTDKLEKIRLLLENIDLTNVSSISITWITLVLDGETIAVPELLVEYK